MEKDNFLDKTLNTVDEIHPEPQPAASSTPENEEVLLPRRSGRIKPVRIPCECCTTGMHVRCFTSVSGRRPIHSPSQPQTQMTTNNVRVRIKRVNKNESQNNQSNTAASPERNHRKVGPNLGKQPQKRKIADCGDISDPQISTTPDINYPKTSKRARIDNMQAKLFVPQTVAITEKADEEPLRAEEINQRMPVACQISPRTGNLSMEQNKSQATQTPNLLVEVKKKVVVERSELIKGLKMEDNMSETAKQAKTIQLLTVESMDCDEVPVETSLQTHVEIPLENSATKDINLNENGSQHDEHNMISPPGNVIEMPEDLDGQPTEESRQLIANTLSEEKALTPFQREHSVEEAGTLQGDAELQNSQEVEQQVVNMGMSRECEDAVKPAPKKCLIM